MLKKMECYCFSKTSGVPLHFDQFTRISHNFQVNNFTDDVLISFYIFTY